MELRKLSSSRQKGQRDLSGLEDDLIPKSKSWQLLAFKHYNLNALENQIFKFECKTIIDSKFRYYH